MRRRRRVAHHTWQTAFAAAAIATAVALPVVLLTVGGGVSAHEVNALESSGYQIVVSASGVHGITDAHGLAERIAALPGVAAASPVLSEAVDLFVGRSGPTPALAEGVVPAPFEATESPAERSLFPAPLPLGDPTDLVHYANGSYQGASSGALLVSTPLAQSYHLTVGSTVLLAPAPNRSLGTSFRVSGLFGLPPATLGPTAAYGLVLPLSDLQVVAGFARANGTTGPLLDEADTLEVALASASAASLGAISGTAKQIQALVPFYSVSTLTEQAQSIREASAVLTGFYLGLSSVGLIIGLVFLTLVLVRRVEQQRRSIGVRRAIGVPAGQIAREMVAEGLRLSAAGAVAGVAGGIAIVEGLAQWGTPLVREAASLAVFDPSTLLLLVLAILALSLAASAVATRAALRISIPEALR